MPQIPPDVCYPLQPLRAALGPVAARALAGQFQAAEATRASVAADRAADPGRRPIAAVAALRLQRKGQATLAHETNLARAAVWRAREDLSHLVAVSVLYGEPFLQREGKPLTVADQRWFAELTTRWMRERCPATLRVRFSLRDAAEGLGYSAGGGRQLQLVRASLLRLRAATFESVVRRADGTMERTIWGLLERARVTQPRTGPARGGVELNRQVADLLQDGSVTYLHAPTWDGLRRRDELAARLWVFLEADQLSDARYWRYPLFASLADGTPQPSDLPAVSDLLGLRERAVRRKTVARIREATRCIVESDPRYAIEIFRSAQPGMWRLEVRRRRQVPET